MALKPCRECKSEVSSKAEICPNCGISRPVKSGVSLIWVILFCIIAFIIFSPKNNDVENVKTKSESNNPAEKQISINATKLEAEVSTNAISNSGNLIIKVASNLPEGTLLSVDLASPINRGGNGYFGQSKLSLSAAKSADVGPFTQNGKPLAPGFYMVTVSISSLIQPTIVQSIIGINGENLKGNNVFKLAGMPERMVWQRYDFELKPDGSIDNFSRIANSDADSTLIPIE